MIVLSYEEDRSAAHRAGHGVAKEAFFHHEHAGSARAANEFVAGEEHGVFCDQGLHQTGRKRKQKRTGSICTSDEWVMAKRRSRNPTQHSAKKIAREAIRVEGGLS